MKAPRSTSSGALGIKRVLSWAEGIHRLAEQHAARKQEIRTQAAINRPSSQVKKNQTSHFTFSTSPLLLQSVNLTNRWWGAGLGWIRALVRLCGSLPVLPEVSRRRQRHTQINKYKHANNISMPILRNDRSGVNCCRFYYRLDASWCCGGFGRIALLSRASVFYR